MVRSLKNIRVYSIKSLPSTKTLFFSGVFTVLRHGVSRYVEPGIMVAALTKLFHVNRRPVFDIRRWGFFGCPLRRWRFMGFSWIFIGIFRKLYGFKWWILMDFGIAACGLFIGMSGGDLVWDLLWDSTNLGCCFFGFIVCCKSNSPCRYHPRGTHSPLKFSEPDQQVCDRRGLRVLTAGWISKFQASFNETRCINNVL